jgi:glycine cleavage system H protein
MSDANEVKPDRRYTRDHEWAKSEGQEILVGITAFAVSQLGEITLVNYDVKEGEAVASGQVFGTIESVKTLSDLFAPVAGTIRRVNKALEVSPESVNEDCWDKGWMVAITPAADASVAELLDVEAYRAHIATLEA